MKERKQVADDREIIVANHSSYETRVTAKIMATALSEMKADEFIIKLHRRQEHVDPGFGGYDHEKIWVDQTQLTVRKYREETDEEYFKRMKQEEDYEKHNTERERLEYLRLKAKFEPETEIT